MKMLNITFDNRIKISKLPLLFLGTSKGMDIDSQFNIIFGPFWPIAEHSIDGHHGMVTYV